MRSGAAAIATVLAGLVLGLFTAGPANATEPGRDAAPVVRVGTEGTYPPFTYVDPRTNQLTGYDIEVLRAVAQEAGWRLTFVQSTFDAIFPALDAQRIDVVANQVTINPERQAKYLFSTPYTYSHGVIVTAADDDSIKTLKDLRGKTTAQSETSNWAGVARDAGAKVQSVEGFAQAAALVQQGRVDAIVNDNIAVLDYLASTGSKQVKIAGKAGNEVSRQALAFRKSDPALRTQANRALASLRADGTLSKISDKYFGADVSKEDSGTPEVRDRSEGSTAQGLWEAAGPMLLGVVKGTIPLTAVGFVFGLGIALATALARLSANPLLQAPARFYTSVIRGTPLLVQLFIAFYGLPQIGIRLPASSRRASCSA